MKPVIGLIGLGAMGNGIARWLRSAGHSLHVFDTRPEVTAAFAQDGGTACGSVAELAGRCDVVISVVVNATQTRDVLFGPDEDGSGCAGAMKPGSVFVMCSTVGPDVSIGFEAHLTQLGVHYLDAPISGGAAKAARGEITMMTAGRPAAYERAGTVLQLSLIHI